MARKLGLAVGTFYNRRRELEARGFPPPIAALREVRPACLRWDPDAIDA